MEGLTPDGRIPEGLRREVLSQLKGVFRPEFLNRVDDTVLFTPLSREQVEKIVGLQLRDLGKRLEESRTSFVATPEALRAIAEAAYDPVFGARPVKRYIQRHVETELSRRIIRGEVPEGSTVTLGAKDGKLDFRVAR